jgi:hypothetical protein
VISILSPWLFQMLNSILTRFFVIVYYKIMMATHGFECLIMMTSVDHQACSPEIDPVASESGQSVNLFCQQSCRLVILVTHFFLPVHFWHIIL